MPKNGGFDRTIGKSFARGLKYPRNLAKNFASVHSFVTEKSAIWVICK